MDHGSHREAALEGLQRDGDLEDLERFVSLSGLPIDLLEAPQEEPNFLLRDVGGSLIGLEHAALVSQGQQTTHRYAVSHFRRELQARLRARGLVFRVVLALQTEPSTISRSKSLRLKMVLRIVDVIATRAAEVRRHDLLVLRQGGDRRDPDPLRRAGLDGVLLELAIESDPGLSEPEVLISMSGASAPGLLANRIERTIRSKERRLPSYREKLGPMPIWLLIVSRTPPAQRGREPDATTGFRTRFDRVYLLHSHRTQLQELRTVPP